MKAVVGDVSIIAGGHLSRLRDMPTPVVWYIVRWGSWGIICDFPGEDKI